MRNAEPVLLLTANIPSIVRECRSRVPLWRRPRRSAESRTRVGAGLVHVSLGRDALSRAGSLGARVSSWGGSGVGKHPHGHGLQGVRAGGFGGPGRVRGAPAPVPTVLKRRRRTQLRAPGREEAEHSTDSLSRRSGSRPLDTPPHRPVPPALVHPLRVLGSSAIELQLPACTAKAGRLPSPASTDSAANRRERPPSGSQSPRRGAGPPAPYFLASFPLCQWECPQRAASAPPPALAPGFRVPGPQRGESAAGGRGVLGRRRRCRLRRQPAGLARSGEVEPRAGEPQLRPAGGPPGRPPRPERAGLPGVGS